MNLIELPMAKTKRLQSVLVKPAGADCNLDCTYCFYLEKSKLYPETRSHRMSIGVLEEMIRQVMKSGESFISFGWQGGEPTLMGLDFYRKATSLQQKYGYSGQQVGNGFQTNGLLITQEWCNFFKEYAFLIGLSLDGPQHVHDRYRITKGSSPSWGKAVDAAKRMLDQGVAVNALPVVNDYSAQFGREIYHFLKTMGFEFLQFIPCLELDPNNPDSPAPYSVSADAYGRFLCDIFDCWKADFQDGRPTTSVRYIDSVFHTYVNLRPPECTLLQECGCYVVVEYNGDVYACDFFVEPHWKLGNVMEDNLSELLNSTRQTEFGRLKKQLPAECPSCPWLTHCWGGCTKDRLRNPASRGSNHFCLSYKIFFDYADADLRKLAEDWMEKPRLEKESHRPIQIQLSSLSSSIKVGRNDPCPCGSGLKYKKCCG